MRIVGFVRVGEDAVHERRIDRTGDDVRAEHGCHGTAGLRARQRQRCFARRQLGA
jgi:hypothetical protein